MTKIEELWTFEPYSGYEWSTIVVYRDTERNLYAVDSQSGCSCNMYERPADEELQFKSWNDFLTDARMVISEGYWENAGGKSEALAKLASLRRPN